MTILSCSFGKDSLASVIICHRMGIKIDYAVYCEVMFDEETPATLPEHRDFIYNVAIPKLESWGIHTIVLKAEKTAKDVMLTKNTRGKRIGDYYCWPMLGGCVIMSKCKMRPIRDFKKKMNAEHEGWTEIVGIAYDEPQRYESLTKKHNKRSVLYENKITQQTARELCEEEGLLSPIYKIMHRDGCFFCVNRSLKYFKWLKVSYPELYDKMLKLEYIFKEHNKCRIKFNYKYTFEEIDERVNREICAERLQGTFDFMNKKINQHHD